MIAIRRYQEADFSFLADAVAAIQREERRQVPELRPPEEIRLAYAHFVLRRVQEADGLILLACAGAQRVGVICAWTELDDDMLLQAAARAHAYVSDLHVEPAWRRQGVAARLLAAVEAAMAERGCRQLRICAKAANQAALATYAAQGFTAYEVTLAKPLHPPAEPR